MIWRNRRLRAVLRIAVIFGLAAATPAAAQLRPWEPLEWEIFSPDRRLLASVGAAAFAGQRASLAGVRGDLFEIGMLSLAAGFGRVAVTADGTALRRLDADELLAPPAAGTDREPGPRTDVGDFRIATAIRLTGLDDPVIGTLRFGTRLPTTDNRVGLERDQTDFFATLGASADLAAVRAAGELGVGIHGTREADYEQSDVLIFLFGLSAPALGGEPSLWVLGHADGLANRSIRGNEELAELRFRVRSPGPRWFQLEVVRGVASYSPTWGLTIRGGIRR